MKEGNIMEYKKSQSLSEQVADEILDMIVVKKQFNSAPTHVIKEICGGIQSRGDQKNRSACRCVHCL